ncbi:MAG TPA: lytic murein transglycosylase [Solirubrobacteraceae bacterium]|nr:lytic murein transglycosylase [Solirubrobacteraceae bacterium]
MSIRLLLPALALLALLGAPTASLAGASSPQGEGKPAATGTTTTSGAPGSPSEQSTFTPPPEQQPSPPAQTTGTSDETPAPSATAPAEAAPPEVQAEHPQGASPSGWPTRRARSKPGAAGGEGTGSGEGGVRAKQHAPSPSALTPSLPFSLRSSIAGVPDFFIESFQIPPFLLPIFQAAGTAYGVPWQVLAAINEVETDYGRDLSVSSAGAEGWMQFLPTEWTQYGVDANGDGWRDPYNPADAIFAAARYLRAAGANRNIKAAIYAYNHSQAYVESVMLRAQLLGGTPSELLGAITGLTEARFPVHAPSHYSDGFPTVAGGAGSPSGSSAKTLVGTTIYSQAGAPVIAVQDGEVVQVGESPSLGHFVALRDAYGNTYVYAQLGEVASVYPVLEPRVDSALSARIARPGGSRSKSEPAPQSPATAGAQPRSPLSEGAAISGLALGAAASLEAAPSPSASPSPAAPRTSPPKRPRPVHEFTEGPNDVYLHPLVPGAQVIAGTVLGHVGAGTSGADEASPHILFQTRPAGAGAPLIDPKPILDGWVALEATSVFRARGENPFLATSPTVGQVLLESKQQLESQVLHASSREGDGGIHLSVCGRQDIQEGRVDKRVLAMLEYLSVSGLRPSVAGLPCEGSPTAAVAANAPASASSEAVRITAVNGIPIAGHQGQGSIADETVRKLLMLQGLARPQRVLSLMSYPGAADASASPAAADAIHVAFAAPAGKGAHAAALAAAGLSPSEWIELIDRLGEIPDPSVASGHSSAAIADAPAAQTPPGSAEGEAGGNH